MKNQPICCPNCYTDLDWVEHSTRQTCPTCGCPYEIRDGIIDFAPDDQFYWGEIPRDDMVRVNDRAEQAGWFQSVLENVIDKSTRDLSGYLFDPRRIAGLFHYYDPDRNESCLDLGSGWGTLSFGLRHFYRQVYSMDGVYERLRFQAIRLEQENVSNVRIIKGSMLKLPVQDNSMDVVIVNGLLEWIGLSDDVTHPRTLQIQFLHEVKRVLKPGGRIFIGIENRFGADQFLGTIDHSGVRYTSLLPRSVANLVVRHAKRLKRASVISRAHTEYRTWTYSSWGYRRLLNEVGFKHPEIFWTWPSYNYPHASGSLDSTSMKAYLKIAEKGFPDGVKRTLVRSVQFVPSWLLKPVVQTFSPYFLILASKEKLCKGLQERILEPDHPRSFFRITPKASSDLKSSFVFTSGNGIEKVVDIACERNHNGMGISISDQNGAQGRPIEIYSSNHVRTVAQWLVDFQQQSQKGYWSYAEIESEMASLIEVVKRQGGCPDLCALLNEFEKIYLDRASSTSYPIVAEHGNLSSDHILITPAGNVQALDWEYASPAGNPLMDVGAFYLSLLPNAVMQDHHRPEFREEDPVAEFTRNYRESMDLPIDLSLTYYVLRGLKRDVGHSPVCPDNYLIYRSWIRLLEPSLDYALKRRV